MNIQQVKRDLRSRSRRGYNGEFPRWGRPGGKRYAEACAALDLAGRPYDYAWHDEETRNLFPLLVAEALEDLV